MDFHSFQSWLEAYKRAWETRDPQAVGELFSEDATYQETPFVAPLRGRTAIRRYWSDVVERSQEQIRFGYEILSIAGNVGIAHWWASFARLASGKKVALDGIFLLTFDAQDRCEALREWWVRKEQERTENDGPGDGRA